MILQKIKCFFGFHDYWIKDKSTETYASFSFRDNFIIHFFVAVACVFAVSLTFLLPIPFAIIFPILIIYFTGAIANDKLSELKRTSAGTRSRPRTLINGVCLHCLTKNESLRKRQIAEAEFLAKKYEEKEYRALLMERAQEYWKKTSDEL